MRLWHEALIPYLPRQQLLGQHRECCALRGLGWGKKHATVDYVFKHPYEWLIAYHEKVMSEMLNRGYNISEKWFYVAYRGKNAPPYDGWNVYTYGDAFYRDFVYPEHNDEYLKECLNNLAGKGIYIDMEEK